MRGQGSLEYLIITAAVLAISAVVVLFLTGALGGGAVGAQVSACKQVASQCALQRLGTTGAACMQCDTSCIDNAGKDIMSGTPGCGVACGFCKLGKALRISGPLPAGIVGFWPFEENTGTSTADVSGNANTATINNGAAWTNGKLGYALSFDGVDDYTRAPNSGSLNINGAGSTVSIGVWFKANTLPSWQNIIYKGDSDTTDVTYERQYALWLNSAGYIHLTSTSVNNIGGSQTYVDTPSGIISAGQWYHVAGVIDSVAGTMKIYVNGVQQASGAYSTTGIRSGAGGLFFGISPAGISPFNAIIDEVQVYNRALSADEISVLYAAGK